MNMNGLNGRVTIFLRYILSFLVVVIIPLLIFLLFIYPYVMKVLTNKVMEGDLEVISHVENAATLQFQNIYRIPVEISNNRTLARYNLTSSNYNALLGIEELAKYLNTNSFVFNVLLYWRGDNRFFSNKAIFDMTEIGHPGLFYYYPHWKHQDFLREIDTVITPSGPVVRPAEPVYYYGTKYYLVTFVFSLPRTIKVSSGTLLIFVEEKTIHQLIKSSSPQNDSNIIIVSDKGKIITALKKDRIAYTKETKEIIQKVRNKGSTIYNINREKYIVSYVQAQNGWKYLSLTPLISAQKELVKLRTLVVMIFLIIIALEVFIIYYAMKANYYPIQSMVRVAREVVGSEKTQGMNEYDLIKAASKNISVTKEDAKRIELESPAFSERNSFLYEIINGNIKSPEKLQERQSSTDLVFLYHTFGVFIISIHTEKTTDRMRLKKFLLEYEQQSVDGVQAFFLTDIQAQKVIAVSSQKNGKVLTGYLEQLQERIQNEFNCRIFIGVGEIKDELTNLYQSYNEAFAAIDYLDMKKSRAIIFHHQIPINLNKAIEKNFPADRIYLLDFAVLKSDIMQIRKSIKGIILIMTNEDTPVYMIRLIYYSVINILIRGLMRFESVKDERKLGIASSSLFVDSCTLDQLVNLIQETTDKMCELMIDSSRTIRNSLICEIIDYVEANFMDPEFSIQVVAEHFNMTPSNFSHYFKNNTQHNFKEYVDYLRINKAKQLLTGTSDSIEEIAQIVCYSNASNFSRGFKKIVGVTPGEYRKN